MLSLILSTLLTAAPVESPPTALGAAQTYEVVRGGDGAMSCQALIGEINQLNAETAAHQQAAAARISGAGMRPGMATANTAVGMLTSLLPFGGGLVQSAVSDAQNAARMQTIKDASASMTADVPVYSRIEHLTELSRRRGC